MEPKAVTHTLTFTSGTHTCASEAGVFCRWCGSKGFGTRSICTLFNEPLFDKDGWLQRSKTCLETFPSPPGNES